MVVKMTNQQEKFYQYMGKIFGSRIVQSRTNDRIYDDNDKEWYLYLEEDKVMACVAISKNVIKNIYTKKEEYLEEILVRVKQEVKITNSVVTNCYEALYEKVGFEINRNKTYKNFVMIDMKK